MAALRAQRERDPQRDRGQGVGEVVDGVGQQRDRPGDQHDDQLRDRGGAEREQADLDRPDAGGAGFQRAVDAVGGVVAVRGEDLPQRRRARPSGRRGCGRDRGRGRVPVTVVVPVAVVPWAGRRGSSRGVRFVAPVSSRSSVGVQSAADPSVSR